MYYGRRVLFVIFQKYGHTFQMIWEPGFEQYLSDQIDKWIFDDGIPFTVDDGVEFIESAINVVNSYMGYK